MVRLSESSVFSCFKMFSSYIWQPPLMILDNI